MNHIIAADDGYNVIIQMNESITSLYHVRSESNKIMVQSEPDMLSLVLMLKEESVVTVMDNGRKTFDKRVPPQGHVIRFRWTKFDLLNKEMKRHFWVQFVIIVLLIFLSISVVSIGIILSR